MSRGRPWATLLLLVVILAAGWLAVWASGGLAALIAMLHQVWWAPFAFVAGYTLAIALGVPALLFTLSGGAVLTGER